MQRTQEEKDNCYWKLGECFTNAKEDNIVASGGQPVMGKYGVGNMNSNGRIITKTLAEFH